MLDEMTKNIKQKYIRDNNIKSEEVYNEEEKK